AFVIENYNTAKPLASFFPGISGEYGIPMWVFYVNRGQGVVSFGIKDRDSSIMEFLPANKAWESVSLSGFRTFIKVMGSNKSLFYEPFHNGFSSIGYKLTNRMSITSYDLRIEEDNLSLGLRTEVDYFNIPSDNYAGLVRILTLRNLSNKIKRIQLLDGLPKIVPYGVNYFFLKRLSRTIEAWMTVENLEKGVPFYKLGVDPVDRPQVVHLKEGNFYLPFSYEKGSCRIIKPIVDPEAIFGPVLDFSYPYYFLKDKVFKYPKVQLAKNKTPCGVTLINAQIPPLSEIKLYSIIGNMRSLHLLNDAVPRIAKKEYLEHKRKENIGIIEALQNDIDTKSSCREFDLYSRQTYLDNIMRGGYPVIFKSKLHKTVFYLYSRKHGDLERDYNKFQIQPTYFSQGNGNYRDINQNRRCDVWFNPEVQDDNIITFFNLIQTDGFNPLVVKGVSFILTKPDEFKPVLESLVKAKVTPEILEFFEKPFTPGSVILFLEEKKITLKVKSEEFINVLLSHCDKIQEAYHKEGYWTDHWVYNLDLLENYLAIYPEKSEEILFNKRVFTFFDNDQVVKPRSCKYILLDQKPKQLHALYSDEEKKDIIFKRKMQIRLSRKDYGRGEIYYTSLINKLMCLVVNKSASLDPQGSGIEMESDKPNWFDALNGLPALFGSSTCETFELKRLGKFIKEKLQMSGIKNIALSEEIHDFLDSLDKIIKEYLELGAVNRDYIYWDKSSTLKENYRLKNRFGLSGKEVDVSSSSLISFLNNLLIKIDIGLNKALVKKDNIYTAYFYYEVLEYDQIKDGFIMPRKFTQKRLPFFLESQVHALRLVNDIGQARRLYRAVRNSQLYDKKLGMYKVTAPLDAMPEEIGRCRAFTPGWLENESIWLHMEYKYLLEIIKCGLYEEFYADFKGMLIPFQDPARYGRSILENSSFLVSSAFPDKRLHGTGFVSRLSGSTAEFLNIWLLMNIGKEPFFLNDKKQLCLKFDPILPKWLFNKDKSYSFNFLSKIMVTYHNPRMKNTFGPDCVRIRRISFKDQLGNPVELSSSLIPAPYAQQIRSRLIQRIDIYLK
ncbi:MAG: cellobiose phosphorylase, partial [Candidatus Omnitrophica bacterium]|nr:cellobiose phosphorylase [Candidatus Omnitrophota bacterium]